MLLLYIDPGTGSMLFSIFIGIAGALLFFVRRLYLKLKFIFSGGKAQKISAKKIPYVIFTDSKRYWNVFKPICDEFESRKITLVYYTASPDDPALQEKYEYVKSEFIGEGNKAFAKLNFLNAQLVLSSTPGLDVYQWKRSKYVNYYVHILHSVEDTTDYRMFGIDHYDAVLMTGSNQEHYIRVLEQLRNQQPKECVITGCTYMDTMEARLEHTPLVHNEEPTVLLAPSWGKSAILSKYGSKILDALIATGYKIIVRPHPQSFISEKEMIEPLMAKYPDTSNFSWNRDNDNFLVLNSSDIMISDYSGVLFDYTLVFDKPLIYTETKFETLPFDADWLDEPMWPLTVLHLLGKKLEEKDFSNLKDMIAQIIRDKSYQDGRNTVRGIAWQNRGSAKVKTVDYLVNKYNELAKEPAINK